MTKQMTEYDFHVQWKRYMNYKYFEKKGIPSNEVKEPKPTESIKKAATKIMQQWNLDTFQKDKTTIEDSSSDSSEFENTEETVVQKSKKTLTTIKKKLVIESSVSGSDSDTISTAPDEYDKLLKITNWKVATYVNNNNEKFANKIWLRCNWEIDKERWDIFEAVQQDEPLMVADYINKNVSCYKMIEKYETMTAIVKENITIDEGALECDAAIIDTKQMCTKDHTDLYNFIDYSNPKYFAENTDLHDAICNICNTKMNNTKINACSTAKICCSYGSTRCNVCVCYNCSLNITLNIDTKKRSRGGKH
jgi:hypothetical protein